MGEGVVLVLQHWLRSFWYGMLGQVGRKGRSGFRGWHRGLIAEDGGGVVLVAREEAHVHHQVAHRVR